MRWLVVAIALGSIGIGVAAFVANRQIAPAADAPRLELFEIGRGEPFGSVARRLEEAGLVRSALAMRLLARWKALDGKVHVGEYELSPHQSADEILSTVTSGRVKTWPFTVPEGSRATEIAARLEEAGHTEASTFLAVVRDPDLAAELGVPGNTLEGYLYPDTYPLPRRMPAEAIARMMVRQFDRVWEEEVVALAGASVLAKNEIVTLASIVEKETAAPEERPLIAAVFLNRLERGMRLETDPTVIYGIADFDGNLRKRHLQDGGNPYNTYRIRGLPPGPIASPGAEALLAVVQPSETEYLYFVSRNDGTHKFSATYKEHSAAVDEYQRRRRSRSRSSTK